MKPKTRKKRTGAWGRGMLWCCLLAGGIYASQQGDTLTQVRTQAQHLLFGDQTPAQVLAAFGGYPQPVETVQVTQPLPDAQPVMAEQGNAGDFYDIRAQALFPDTVDTTVYAIAFANPTPTVGAVSSPFGERISPTTGQQSFHYGLDIAAPQDTPILSLDAGVVAQVGENSYGKYLVVSHDNGTSALYAHCHTLLAKQGDWVTAGQEIAQVGSTGVSTGNHLHIELWRAGKVLDPAPYLAVDGV